jgi:hypothetical protein
LKSLRRALLHRSALESQNNAFRSGNIRIVTRFTHRANRLLLYRQTGFREIGPEIFTRTCPPTGGSKEIALNFCRVVVYIETFLTSLS